MATTFVQPDYTTQADAVYKAAIDSSIAALAGIAGQHAVHEQATPDMSVKINAGYIFDSDAGTSTSLAARNSATLVAPVTNPRIDLVYLAASTGTVGIQAGTESASPAAPALDINMVPLAQIALTVGMTEIANADITDERNLATLGLTRLAATEIRTLTELGAPAVDDLMVLEDTSGTVIRSITLVNMLKVIGVLTAESSPATDDILALYDTSASRANAITLVDLMKVINSLTEDTTPDEDADFIMTYDASAGTVKKVLVTNIGGSFKDQQTFNASGTWTKPGSGTYALVEVWGAGGSGGRGTGAGGGGGGGGAYSSLTILLSGLGATETVTIGAGGAARTTNLVGVIGGTTTFGAFLSAFGGSGGNTGNGGGGGGGGAFTAGLQAGTTTSGMAGGGPGGGAVGAAGLGNPATSLGGGGSGGGNASPRTGGQGYFGGGGGSGGISTVGTFIGGASVMGGGGGGGGSGSGSTTTGGASGGGGAGGAGGLAAAHATAGTQPAGGGGGSQSGNSGAGGDGRVRVTVW